MDYSCGVIPFRRNNDGEVEFFVGHPGGLSADWANYWAYLKGGPEGDETHEEAALREFIEETGLSLSDVTTDSLIPLGVIQQNKRKLAVAFGLYYPNIDPKVCYSNIDETSSHPEIDDYRWMTSEELFPKTHPTHIPFYEQIIDMLS